MKYFMKAADYRFSKTHLWEDEKIGCCVCGLKKHFSYAFCGCSKELWKWHAVSRGSVRKGSITLGSGDGYDQLTQAYSYRANLSLQISARAVGNSQISSG